MLNEMSLGLASEENGTGTRSLGGKETGLGQVGEDGEEQDHTWREWTEESVPTTAHSLSEPEMESKISQSHYFSCISKHL